MKLLFTLLFLPILSFSQSKPIKGATKIIVSIKDAIGIMDSLSIALYKNGYSIVRRDGRLHFISTDKKPVPRGLSEITIQALVTGTAIVFTAKNEALLMSNKFTYTVSYGGMKDSKGRLAWNEL